MSLVIEKTQPVPLAADADGVIRVAGTRVTLDKVAAAFERGAQCSAVRSEIERRFDPQGVRARLLARRGPSIDARWTSALKLGTSLYE